ncbi:MAG TPA: hypothetical protein VIJ40_06650 [Acidimicrobiales bacterium]
MRLFRSLKSTHWVTWSSPLLLLVLVLTLTATSKPTSPVASTSRTTTSSTSHAAAKKTAVATTTIPVAKVTPPTKRPTSTTTLVTIPTTTIARHAVGSSKKIASSVKTVAVASGETVANGDLSGQLAASFSVADVPLDGPGTWSLNTSAPANATLQCANAVAIVQSQVVVAAKDSCQFIIKSLNPSSSLTWQLTPVN